MIIFGRSERSDIAENDFKNTSLEIWDIHNFAAGHTILGDNRVDNRKDNILPHDVMRLSFIRPVTQI
jgi:hypothetical protein